MDKNTYEVVYLENGEKKNVHIYAKNEAEAGKAFASKYPEIKTKKAILSVEKLVKDKKSMNLSILGIIIGVVIARYYWFDVIEVFGWELFWETLTKKGINQNDLGEIIKSATFMKTVIASIIGGIAGLVLERLIWKEKK